MLLPALWDTQENKVPIADFPSGALLRECTLQRSTHPVLYLEARPFSNQATAKPVCCRILGWRKPNTMSSLEIPASIKSVATPSSVSSHCTQTLSPTKLI